MGISRKASFKLILLSSVPGPNSLMKSVYIIKFYGAVCDEE